MFSAAQKLIETEGELPDEDEAVEHCERAEIVRVGLSSESTGLENDERENVPDDSDKG